MRCYECNGRCDGWRLCLCDWLKAFFFIGVPLALVIAYLNGA